MTAGLILWLWKPFGSTPSKELQEEYAKRTEYFYDGIFHQMEEFSVLTDYEGEESVASKNQYPTDQIPVDKISEFPSVKEGEWNVTWFGHSTVMLQIDDKKIFIDPMLSEYSSPIQAFYGKRMAELPMDAEDIPEVDVVVFSHDHYDHLDYNTIKKIDSKVKEYIVPLGVDQHLIRWGVDENKIHTVAWWDEIEVSGITFTSTPAQHYSGRLPWRNNTTLFGGYVMQKDGQQIYYTGDTGYAEFFKDINERFGKMDLVIMENGQYDKMWADCHMMPEEGVEAAKILQADVVLPVHWAGFVLSNHSWKEPIERYTNEAEKEQISVITPQIGESVGKNDIAEHMNKWWENLN
ncbi:Zn-dependent hydrolase [Lachnospiraceae bacterium TWA4]|nr:Zn-dependent hydrolase [Lachnospiraceae bacterium TWA4]